MRPLARVDPQRRWLPGVSAARVLAPALPVGPASITHARGAGRFVRGVAARSTTIGTGPVGEGREHQRSATDGDAEQLTTTGLQAGRTADHGTACTGGDRTRLTGPGAGRRGRAPVGLGWRRGRRASQGLDQR